MTARSSIRPSVTTLWAGAGVIVVGLLWFLADIDYAIPVTDRFVLLFTSAVPQMTSSLIVLAVTAVLAFGIHEETSIVGSSIPGKVALLLYGITLGSVTQDLIGSLSLHLGAAMQFADAVFLGVGAAVVLTMVSGLVAGVAVVRANILQGFARWALLTFVIVHSLATILSWVPLQSAVAGVETVRLLSFGAMGVAYLLQGRAASIRNRLQEINAQW